MSKAVHIILYTALILFGVFSQLLIFGYDKITDDLHASIDNLIYYCETVPPKDESDLHYRYDNED